MGGLELLLPVLILLPLLLIIFRGRKQQRAFASTQSRIAAGQDVMTTAGLHARIVEVDGDVVVLEVADGVRVRWAKAAIGQIITPPASEPAHGEGVDITKHERRDG